MRRRQICCMHGGYRGSGTTINWNTTMPSGVVSEIPPLPQQDPANLPDITTPITPTPPPTTPIKPPKKSYNIASIVGLTVSGLGTIAAAGLAANAIVKSRSGIVDEENRPFIKMRGTPEEEAYIAEQEAADPELFLSRRPDQGQLERREREFDLEALRGGDPVEFHYY